MSTERVPVVELLRVSTQLQAGADRAGLPAQHATNLRTCAAFGLEAVAAIEIVESGAEVARSPEMRRVLDLIRAGTARGIVVAEYSRLFRPDRWSDFAVLQELYDHDAPIYLPTGPIDLQSELGYVQATINNLLAAMERRRIRERLDRGKEEHRRRGAHVAGGIGLPLGLGYDRSEGWHYTPDIERVREVFRMWLAGERRLAEIARAVGLARSTVRYILLNPVYSGWRVYDERRDLTPQGVRGRHRAKVARPPHEVIRVRLPLVPVVSEPDQAMIRRALSDGRHACRSRVEDRFVYRGLLRCAEDGLPLYGLVKSQAQGRTFQYACRARARPVDGVPRCTTGYMLRDRLEALLDAVITTRLLDVDLLADALDAYAESRQAAWRRAEPDVAVARSHVADLRRQRARVLDLYVAGHIDATERDQRLRALDGDLTATARLVERAPAPPPPDVTAETVGALVGALAEWPSLDRLARRRTLGALGVTFVVGRYRVEGVHVPVASRDSGSRSKTAV